MERNSIHRPGAPQRRLSFPLILVALPVTLLAVPAACRAQSDEVATLRREINRLKADYRARIRALEQRLEALEGSRSAGGQTEEAKSGADELEALRAAARQAAASKATATEAAPVAGGAGGPESVPAPAVAGAAVGHERNLNRLNPEISFTGDVLGRVEGSTKTFDAREFELDLQAALDPFSSTKWTISFGTDEVEVEEGYIRYTGLARGITLRAGRMRQTFGALNRFHQHALPQVDYPLVLRTFFDEEGLAQTGLSVEWLLTPLWASANELTVQLTDGAGAPFGGGNFKRPVLLGHLKNYWDLSPSTYLEWGLSGIGGRQDEGRHTRIWGSDLTLHWQPPAQAKYRELTWRSEGLLSQREDTTGRNHDSWGAYSYLEGLLARNLYAGVRYDWVEQPFDSSAEQWRLGPYVTWWQSEFVRLRGMYQLVRDQVAHDTTQRFILQLTWAAGPHKHESY